MNECEHHLVKSFQAERDKYPFLCSELASVLGVPPAGNQGLAPASSFSCRFLSPKWASAPAVFSCLHFQH